LYLYHIDRLLAEYGVKWMPLVAWEVAQPLIRQNHDFGLFWHKKPTYALNMTQPHIFLPPQHH